MPFLIGSLVVYWILISIFSEWTAEKIFMGLLAALLFCVWYFLAAVVLIEMIGLRFLEDYLLHGLVCCVIAGQVYVFEACRRRGL